VGLDTQYTTGDRGINYAPPIRELTRSHIQDGVECPYPLVPLYDRIVERQSNDTQRIPKTIHLAWIRGYYSPNGRGRCISQDMMEIPKNWMKNFPSYSIYFHDDQAVDALFAQDWPEFPSLNNFMTACVKYGSAMRIDIWRLLVLYRYGGVYGDFDDMPGPLLTQDTIQVDDSAVFSSDAWNRPSQALMIMAPKHPIAYFSMMELMKRLWELNDVSNVKVVFTTGPEVLKVGYWQTLVTTESYETVYNFGLHVSF
jgi:mannosyltransferase OCH1-like enzyme